MATVFTNGALFDGREHLGRGEVRVEGDRIVAVGASVDRADAELVDLAGGLLSPGFVDAHVHAVQGGLERIRCDLSEANSRAGYLDTIARYAAGNPDAPWILGGGWSMPYFPGGTPTAAELDLVVPDRPAFLPNRDHHGAWVNTRALELAGIDAATPDPDDGRIERDDVGRPSGTLHEGAMALVSRHLPATTDEDYDRALREGQRHLHSRGVTAWQDAIVGAYAGMDDPGPVYVRAARDGVLTARVVGALWWDRDRDESQIADLVARREQYTGGRFRATSVKIMQDGIAENFTAAMISPYLDRCGHATANAGHSFVEPGALRRYVRLLDAEGFQIHVHAIGDRGVREALDAFVGTRPELRHHIAHLQVVHPDDLARFAELGISANLQMLWAVLEDQMQDLTLPFLGPERSTWQYPFAALEAAGAHLVAGSDWPVSSCAPLEAIHVGVNRAARPEDGAVATAPFLPEQALSLRSAFAAYTSGSARINRMDDAGRLAPGARADLVTLDRDPFLGPADQIAATAVTSTWVDGNRVH